MTSTWRAHALLYVLFFASGLASLTCEVVWFKQLGFVLGSSTFSASVVVACFFGGLSLGSVALGRWADRVRHPLVAYGLAEGSLAGVSLAATGALASWDHWIGAFAAWMSLDAASALPVKVAIAAAILTPPTVLMGGTLPILVRWTVRARSELSAQVGSLYAVNTLGAAIGCALFGWVVIGAVGVVESAAIASAIYLVIGAVALGVARVTPLPPPMPAEDLAPSDPLPIALLAVFGASGFVAIGYEVLWFRMLLYFAAHTVYTFATFLSVYLLGLVLGSAICARWLAPRRAEHAAMFARLQLAIGVGALVSFGVLGRARTVLGLASAYTPLSPGSLPGLVALAAAVLLPPTILLGLAFPLASEVAVGTVNRLGTRIGALYGANTLGGVLGSVVTGFALLPALGAEAAFEVLIALNFVLFALIVAAIPSLRTRAMLAEGALAVATAGLCVAMMGQRWLADAETAFSGGTVLDFRENEDAAFVVMRYDEPHTGPYEQLIVNGTSYASNRPSFRRYMATLGHLPTLLHPDPQDALVICVGTGTTIGAVSLYPELDPVYAVDVSQTVFDVAPWFEPLNHRFLASPRVRPVVADGRHFLLVSDRRFDVLTFEPPPPQQAGVVNLYSREFYRLADRRMADDGILAQWIPFHEGYEPLQKSLVRTLLETWPHVSLWMPDGYEGIAIASRAPLAIDPARIAARMTGAVGQDLHEVGFDAPEDLLATFVAADDDLAAWVGDVAPVTDDKPVIEYFLGRDNERFRNSHLDVRPIEPRLAAPADPDRLQTARAKMLALWQAEDAVADDRWPDAKAAIARARTLAPDDVYVRYEAAQIEISANAAPGR